MAASLRFGLLLTMTIGVGCVSMILRVVSKPSILGRWMSIVITSGCVRRLVSRASSPELAVPTTLIPGAELRI